MPTKPRDIERLAIELSRRTGSAELRAALGRAYYAAFNAAAELFRGWKIPIPQNASGHGEVLRYMGNSGDDELVDAAYQLGRLRSWRNASDYDLFSRDVEVQSTVQLWVNTATQILATLERCQEASRRAKIVAEIENYRRRIAPSPPP